MPLPQPPYPGPEGSYEHLDFDVEVDAMDSYKPVDGGLSYSFHNINYRIKVEDEMKTIVSGVSGHVPAGCMLAILGPSGAGKTTLLDCIAMRKKTGEMTGDLFLGGQTTTKKAFQRNAAYVLQEDLFMGGLTVYETIMFSALLRLPESVPKERLEELVCKIIDDLGLTKVKDSKIGNQFFRGISGGEKKRLAIGCELVTQPKLLLLDEPTSGLDAYNAYNLIKNLRALSHERKQTVISTIHQPSPEIFRLFDRVLLMGENGRVAFFGAPHEAMPHFTSAFNLKLASFVNPADYFLNLVVHQDKRIVESNDPNDPLTKVTLMEISGAYTESQTYREMDKLLESFKGNNAVSSKSKFADRRAINSDENTPFLPYDINDDSEYVTGIWRQFSTCLNRAVVNWLRDPIASFATFFMAIFFAMLIGSLYHPLSETHSGIQDRMGCLFFIIMSASFQNLSALEIFLLERAIYYRETAKSMYRTGPYLMGKLIADVPQRLFPMIVFSSIVYWFAGFYPSGVRFIMFMVIQFLVAYTSYAFCLFVSSFAPSFAIANIIAPCWIMLLMLPSGFLQNLNSIPVYWSWLKYISFQKYGFEALVVNEFHGLDITCAPSDLICPGKQLPPWLQNVTDSEVDKCYCPPLTGNDVIEKLGMSEGMEYWDCLILSIMIAVYIFGTYLVLSFYQRG